MSFPENSPIGSALLVDYFAFTLYTLNAIKSLEDSERINLRIEDCQSLIITTNWYKQIGGRCTLYAAINAQIALGLDPDTNIARLCWKEGNSLNGIQDQISNNTLQTNFDMVQIDTLRGSGNPRYYGKRLTDEEYPTTPSEITNNANIIIDNINNKHPLLVDVDSEILYQMLGITINEVGLAIDGHTLAITGYQVKNGLMSVAVLDSNIGLYYLPIELLSKVIIHNSETYAAYINSPDIL
jgi:hypothetical protein